MTCAQLSAKPSRRPSPSQPIARNFAVAVRGQTYAVGDDVGVALEATLGVAVRGLVAGQVPDDESLVARSGQEHVGAGAMLAERLRRAQACKLAGRRCSSQLRRRADALLKRGSEGSNPARVALEGATENQLLGHDCGFGLNLESTSAVVSVRSSCAHCGISSCGRRPCFGDGNTWGRALRQPNFTRTPTPSIT